jgi:hypothetical protein
MSDVVEKKIGELTVRIDRELCKNGREIVP